MSSGAALAIRPVVHLFMLVIVFPVIVSSSGGHNISERAERALSTNLALISSGLFGGGGLGTLLSDPSLYYDAQWQLGNFLLVDGYRFMLDGGTLMNNTFVYPPGSPAAFAPMYYSVAQRSFVVLRDATVVTLCSTITDFIQYYTNGGPGAGAANLSMTALSPHAFHVDRYDFNSSNWFRVNATNVTYTCNPALNESTVVGYALGGSSDRSTAIFHQASLLGHSTNILIYESVLWGSGPGYNSKYKSSLDGATWPAAGFRFSRGSYRITSGVLPFDATYQSPLFGAFDGSSTPKIASFAPGTALSLTSTYLYGMCAQRVALPSAFISFSKNVTYRSNGTANASASILPLAAPLWPFQLELPTASSNSSTADAPPARLYVNASTVLVSEQEASTLHYLAALQPHALAAAGADVQAAVVTPAVAQLAQLVLGSPAAAAMLQQAASSANGSAATAAPDFAHLGPAWQPPVNLSAQPVFAAYSTAPGAVRVSWSPTPNGGAMRDTTVGAMEPSPASTSTLRSPSWLGYNPSIATYYPPLARYATLAFCNGTATLASPSSSLFSPPLLTVGGLSPTTPNATRAAMLASSNYCAARAADALAAAANWMHRVAAANANANGSASSYLPPIVLLFANATLGAAATTSTSTSTTATNTTSAAANATTTPQTPLDLLGPMILAGPVPPPSGLPTTGSDQLVPGFAALTARPTLDLTGAVDVLRIAGQTAAAPAAAATRHRRRHRRRLQQLQHLLQPDGSISNGSVNEASSNGSASGNSSNGSASGAPVLLLQRLHLTDLAAQAAAAGSAPVALPLWAFDRPGRNATSANSTAANSSAQLVLTSVTLQLPAAEFAALCALARLSAQSDTNNQQSLASTLLALRASAAASDNGSLDGNALAFVNALSHAALDGVTALGSPTITITHTAVYSGTSSTGTANGTGINGTAGGSFNVTSGNNGFNATTNSTNSTAGSSTSSSASNGFNATTTATSQSLHLATYAGWGAVGADLLLVPDAPLDSITAIMAADVGALAAAMLQPPPAAGPPRPPLIRLKRPPSGASGGTTDNTDGSSSGADSGSSNGLTTGGAVGIGVGIGLGSVVVVAAAGVAVMLRHSRRRRQLQKQASASASAAAFSSITTAESDATSGFSSSLKPDQAAPGAALGTRATGTAIISSAGQGEAPASTASSAGQGQATVSSSSAGGSAAKLAAVLEGGRGPATEIKALAASLRGRGKQQQQQQQLPGGADAGPLSTSEELVLMEVLGQGSGGTVYEGSWKGLAVAVKAMIIPDDTPVAKKDEAGAGGEAGDAGDAAADEARPPRLSVKERAVTEAAVCCALAHPNVITTYHYELSPVVATAPNIVVAQQEGGDGGQAQDWKLYLVQELCDASLTETIAAGLFRAVDGAPLLHLLLPMLRDVASGMAYLHSRDIIHGDLKPDNVLLKTNSDAEIGVIAKVSDFGLAVTLDPTLTHVSNYRAGTPFYIAPEVAQEARMTKAADVYSFGVLAWEAVLGLPPWERLDGGEFKSNEYFWVTAPAQATGSLQPFKELCGRCISRDPRARPSFEDVLAQLAAIEAVVE